MLLEQWNDDDGVFAALAFMDRDAVGELNFREFALGVFDVFFGKFDGEAGTVSGDGAYDAHVAVEDIFVIVVACLNDFVANAESATAVEDFRRERLACFFAKMYLCCRGVVGVGAEFGFSGGFGVERFLYLGIQYGDAACATMHGGHHLNVSDWVYFVVFGDVFAD